MFNGKKIISIAPAFNEEGKIGKVVESVPKDIVDTALVVNDGSQDNTLKEFVEKVNVPIVWIDHHSPQKIH